MRILHVITSLHGHGAQHMLQRLVKGSDASVFTHEVVSLTPFDAIAADLLAAGSKVTCLNLKSPLSAPIDMLRLRQMLCAPSVDLIQSWLYHADLVASLLAPSAKPLVWNIRNHYPSPNDVPRKVRPILRFLAKRSAVSPCSIVTNSLAAIESHAALGYTRSKMLCIPNGIDVERFCPVPEARAHLRAQLGLHENTQLVGMVARYNAQKDHVNFLDAARRLSALSPNIHFVLCGEWMDTDNAALQSAIMERGLGERVHCLGVRSDLPTVYGAFDIATLSSAFGESFPNVVAESMACGIPTVATDVGDTAHVLGDARWVVPPRSPESLAACWQALLATPLDQRTSLGRNQRERIVKMFSMRSAQAAFEGHWRNSVPTRH